MEVVPNSSNRLSGLAALYLAAMVSSRWNPELATMKARLQETGTPPKVILIACARKLLTILNAIVRDQSEWRTVSPLRGLTTRLLVMRR